MKILIVGGTGAFGLRYAELFSKAGFDVEISGRDAENGKKVASEHGLKFSELKEGVKKADVVIVSVPIEAACDTVSEVAPLCRKDALLMDFTSVKTDVMKEMKKAECDEIVGCHPMHGPRVSSLEGQSVIFVPIKKGEKYKEIRKFFTESKARVIETTADEHDKALAAVQVLTHFVYLSMASTLRSLEIDVKKTRQYASPIYELSLDLIARIIGQNPQVYAQIQMNNPYTGEVESEFIRQAELVREIALAKDNDRFIRMFKAAAEHFGEIEPAMARSDKIIAAANAELRELKSLVGKKICLKNVQTDALHYGKLEDVSADEICITEKGPGKKKALKISNVILLRGEELKQWKMKNSVARDISFVLPEFEPAEVCAVGASVDYDILKVEVKDTYRMKDGSSSVTLRFAIFADSDVKGIEERIRKRFIGLGIKTR